MELITRLFHVITNVIFVLNTLEMSPTERKLNHKHKNNFYTSGSVLLNTINYECMDKRMRAIGESDIVIRVSCDHEYQ